VMLHTSRLNVFWAIEAVVLLYISQKAKIPTLRSSASGILMMSFLIMFVDWKNTYNGTPQDFFFNGAVFSTSVSLISIALTVWLLLREEDRSKTIMMLSIEIYSSFIGGFGIFIFWLIGNIEFNYHTFSSVDYARLLISIFNMSFVMILWSFSKRLNISSIKEKADILMGFMMFFYILYGWRSSLQLRDNYLINGDPIYPFLVHYINVGLSFLIGFLLMKDTYERNAFCLRSG
jgi:uncharacterized membrane protein